MNSVIITLITAIVSALLSCFITLYVSKRSQLNNNTDALKNLYNRLGLCNEETLRKSILNKFNAILNDIGRENSSSLTQHHKDMEKLLQKEIEIIEQRYSNENKLLMDFTYQQQNIYKTMEDFNLFMQDWKRLTVENNELKATVISFSQQLENANSKIKQLESQISNQQKNHKHQKDDFSI